jgi:uncharacterized Zn-finger protein
VANSRKAPHHCTHPGCTKRFTESSTLKRHQRVHTGEKPYKCSYRGCGKSFADATNVKRHETTHSTVKPFICPDSGCRRSFSRGSSLKQHLINHHDIPADSELILACVRKSHSSRLSSLVQEYEKNGIFASSSKSDGTASSDTKDAEMSESTSMAYALSALAHTASGVRTSKSPSFLPSSSPLFSDWFPHFPSLALLLLYSFLLG